MSGTDSSRGFGSKAEITEPTSTSVQVPAHSVGWKVWLVLKTFQARLRFIVILVLDFFLGLLLINMYDVYFAGAKTFL